MKPGFFCYVFQFFTILRRSAPRSGVNSGGNPGSEVTQNHKNTEDDLLRDANIVYC